MPPRLLTPNDLPQAMLLKEAAGWNQTRQDWHNVLALAPDRCFGIECDGILASTTTTVCYGRELAWIGMVLTHPEYRGLGLARRLMEHALENLEARQVEWIKLDATDMGRPLYLRLGFEDDCIIERWGRSPGPVAAPSGLPTWVPERGDIDRQAFGADRLQLLRTLAPMGSAAANESDYAMGRPGSKAAYFGPCVSRSVEAARDLLCWFLSQHPQEAVYWDLLPANAEALRLARDFGFQPLRKLVRMARRGVAGADKFMHDDSLVFAIAGFEYG